MPDLNSHKILAIGTNSAYYKGIDILYEAFKIVKKDFPDAELFIVGRIPDLSNYVDCNDKGVHCLGYVEDLKEVIKNSALYVHMGRGDTFPLSTIEAMLGGLPAIVSEWTGTKEVVSKVDSNLIVKLNANEVAKQISRYFSVNYAEKSRLSKKSIKEAYEFLGRNNIKYLKEVVFKSLKKYKKA